jgi:type IV secretory pathway VirJ component
MMVIVQYITICLICLFNNCFFIKAGVSGNVADFPLQLSGSRGSKEVLVVYLTGDGGWNTFNQQMVREFERNGFGVVAINTRKYFWDEKKPGTFARDFELISGYYLKEWGKTSLTIVGYSFGADVAGFLLSRVSADLHKKINLIALLSPSASTDFVIRLSDLIGSGENLSRKYQVGPEIDKADLPVICIFGKDEEKMLKAGLSKKKNLTIYEVPGDHRYNNNFALLLKIIGMK